VSRRYRRAVGDEAVRLLRDSFYVTVGFGVLAFQKLQVRRRELASQLEPVLEGALSPIGRILGRDG